MSIELTNFTQRYEEAVNAIRQIKQSNQRLQDGTSIDYKQEQRIVETARVKVDAWVVDMEKQYLDPQTARRVDIVKQQLNTEVTRSKTLVFELSKPKPKTSNKDISKQQIHQSEDEDPHGNHVMFDHDTQLRLNAQKNKQLSQAHQKLLKIHAITQQTKNLTYQQGQVLDIIDQNMSTTLTNTQQSNSYLQAASKEQKKGQKKYVWLGLIVGLAVAVVLIVIFVI